MLSSDVGIRRVAQTRHSPCRNEMVESNSQTEWRSARGSRGCGHRKVAGYGVKTTGRCRCGRATLQGRCSGSVWSIEANSRTSFSLVADQRTHAGRTSWDSIDLHWSAGR